MDEFTKGMVVRHVTLGIGRVVALEPSAVHVFFVEGERREASKLRLAPAKLFLSPAPDAKDERLDGLGLSAFTLDPVSGRWAPARPRPTPARKAKKS